MSLSQRNLSSIQKAGQTVHGASVAIAATVRAQAESMVSSVASQPFGAESEQAIARFKMLARLSQGLAAVEKELQALYSIATDLASPTADVIALPMVTKHEATNASAVDVVAKPAKAIKVKKTRRKAATLTSNDSKLLNYLLGVLKGSDSIAITGSKMAAESGLPLGSVGVSLKKIIASGAVNQVDRGTYQLGTARDSSATEPVTKNTIAKKSRQALTKKVKSISAEVPQTKTATAKPANTAKATPAKKVKASSKSSAKPASPSTAVTEASAQAAS